MLTRKAQFFSIIYLLAAIAYGLYSIATSTGLGGYIADCQLKYFDSAYDIVTIPILMVLLCAPGFAILMLAAKIAPPLVGRPRQQNTPGLAPIGIGQPKQISIKYAVVALLGIGAIISLVLFVKQTRDKHEKVYDIVLSGNPGLPPSRARFIQLTGVPSSAFRAVYKETDRAHHTWMYVYVAVTQEGWTIGDSVRYFALYEPTEARRSPPDVFTARNPVKFAGRIGGTLPGAIRRKFESAGLNIDPSYVVIHYGDLPDAEPDFPFWLPAAAIAGLIAAIALFVAALLGLSRISGRKSNAVGRGRNIIGGPSGGEAMGEFNDKPRRSARPAVLVKGNKIEMALDSDSIEYATTVNAVIQKTGGVVSDFFDRKDGTWTTTILVSGELLKAHFDLSGTTLEWIGKETREFLNLAGWLSAEVETIRASKFGNQLFPWMFRTSLSNHDVCSLLDKCISQFHCEWESEHDEFRIRLLTRRFSGSELIQSDPRLQLSRSLDSDVFRGQFVYSEVSLENINYHLSLRCEISKLLGMPVDCRFMQYGVDDYPGDYIPYEDVGIRE